jgi:hypothetical protein
MLNIQWPSAAQPARIITPFDVTAGSLGIASPTGTTIKAGIAGSVISIGADYVQVRADVYTITYSNLRSLKVQAGQSVTADTVLGESAGPDSIRLMLQQTVDPTGMLVIPPAPQPEPVPTPGAKVYVQPTADGVRLRNRPVDGDLVVRVGKTDVLESLESIDATKAKLGVEGQWLNVRKYDGSAAGYIAAQFIGAYTGPIPPPAPQPVPVPTGSITGMNLDMNNRLGHPSPDRLKGIGWIRVKFNVSYNPDNKTYGNTDVNAAFNRMKPFLEPYVKAGIKVLVVFTHQLYGEGAGYNWQQMDTGRWNDLIPKYADFAKRAAALLSNAGLVHAYQIWNEQDTPPAVARAAVPVPAAVYGNMLTQAIRAIRSVDTKTPIITGGHASGPDSASVYMRTALANMPSDVRPDGIASHPYGRGPAGNPFSNFGTLEEDIQKFSAILPGKPVWITEWGVLDRQGNLSVVNGVTDYASGFVNIIKSKFPNKVAAAIWYAWADGMDNGYGLVDTNDQPKSPLYSKFLAL